MSNFIKPADWTARDQAVRSVLLAQASVARLRRMESQMTGLDEISNEEERTQEYFKQLAQMSQTEGSDELCR